MIIPVGTYVKWTCADPAYSGKALYGKVVGNYEDEAKVTTDFLNSNPEFKEDWYHAPWSEWTPYTDPSSKEAAAYYEAVTS